MKAIRLHGRGDPEQLFYEDAPQPEPGPGEVLVRVHATGVIAPELTWPETYETKAGKVRDLPIPGHDLSGVVAAVGPGVSDIALGTEVYALTAFDRDGAEAEYAIGLPSELASKPRSLDHVQAAAVPLTALTAWQAYFEHAGLTAGQTVLVTGAAGGVGVFAVQIASWAGAHVIGTASGRNLDFLRELGAHEAIDYTATRFDEVVHDVDVVLDTVGGETQERSWKVLKKGGVLISVANPPSPEQAKAHGVRSVWFIVEPNRQQLGQIAELIDAGHVRPIIDTVLPLAQARQAFAQGASGHTRGKIVLRVKE
ncbi:NADP-dependent oxidoreductase [Ktedonosporobacter rubrisoli]|uniref:NADP-dependent oxidoreductase n=1 Tax=Ktedonosporobacter rubrisoli TaxID=2509675 RepID=A0A4P6JMF3_KTERU|nr:NADP-dependent oxidoreductase [Ktedonosporobacter rubrisoli]QBD76404.1 NADP-dependent oxidoreductase [Ktedonosporobacter rubrisoli]